MDYICQCCNEDQVTASNLNKHLNTCCKYDEWIKNYKPPSSKLCILCHRNFIDISKHECNRKK